MNKEKYVLQNLSVSGAADDATVTRITATLSENNGEDDSTPITRVIVKSDKPEKFEKAMSLIDEYKLGSLTDADFNAKFVALALSDDVVGIRERIESDAYVSAHVAIKNNKVYVDGIKINDVLERQILLLFNENQKSGTENNWLSFVHLAEKLYSNTSEYVRNQLYGWFDYQISSGKLTLTPEGNFVAYKGGKLETQGKDIFVTSLHQGHGFINGKEVKNDFLRNRVGDIIEIPRGEVDPDPSSPCSVGLHVGTWDYASSFAEGGVMTVEVDPANVVSVPSDYNSQKVRVCRYKVLNIVNEALDCYVYQNKDTHNDTKAPERISRLLYRKLDGTLRVFENAEVIKRNEDTGSILIHGDFGYRTLDTDLIESVRYESDSDTSTDCDDELLIPDFNYIKYVTKDGSERTFIHPKVIDVDSEGRKITINTSDGKYRTLLFDNINFLI